MKLVQITGRSGLAKDMDTNIIHNINSDEVIQARLRKRSKIESKQEMENLKLEVNHVRSELSDIKTLITQLLEKS